MWNLFALKIQNNAWGRIAKLNTIPFLSSQSEGAKTLLKKIPLSGLLWYSN